MAKIEKFADKLQRKQYLKDKSYIHVGASIIDHALTQDQMFNKNPNLRKSGVELPYTKEQVLEIRRCLKSPHYFINNYCYIVNLDTGLTRFKTRDYQNNLVSLMHENKRVVVKFPRQSGKTVTTAAYAVWQIIFQPYSAIAILANKEMTAKGILQKVRLIYENLPTWMQVGVEIWNKKKVRLENGSEIAASATSSSAIRSMAISTLIIDECAFVDSGVWGEFFASVYPTVSSSKKSKIFLISTPKGMNHFYKFWNDSVNKRSDFVHYEIEWNDVPDRDEKFRRSVIAEFGKEYWSQEFECEFLGSAGTLISGPALKNMSHDDPIEEKFNHKFKIYELPVKKDKLAGVDAGSYVAIVDTSEGVGNDSSTVQVFDVSQKPYRQVAVYRNNLISIRDFPFVIETMAKFYNMALLIVENNTIGEAILNDLVYDLEYDNIFYDKEYGIEMNKKTKSLGNSNLKTNIEDGHFRIVDLDTIQELTTYVRVKTSYQAEKGKHDDTVTPLVIFSYFLRNEFWVDQWLDQTREKPGKAMLDAMTEDLLPIGFVADGGAVGEIGQDRHHGTSGLFG